MRSARAVSRCFWKLGAETFLVHFDSLFRGNLLCQVQREAEGIVQFERIHTGQNPFLPSCAFDHILHQIVENTEACVNGAEKRSSSAEIVFLM